MADRTAPPRRYRYDQGERWAPRSAGIRLFVPAVLSLIASLLGLATQGYQREAASPYPLSRDLPYGAAPRLGAELEAATLDAVPVPVLATLRRGDTLHRILEASGLDRQLAWEGARALGDLVDPRGLRAGAEYVAYYDQAFRLARFSLQVPGRGHLWLQPQGEGMVAHWREHRRTHRRTRLDGVLSGALEASIEAAGSPPTLAYEMADVLQWDLDFNRDLRAGDRFTVVYEELWLDGRFHAIERVDALLYRGQKRLYEAYRFDDGGARAADRAAEGADADGLGGSEASYYDGQGRPLRKQFLRSPLRYSRVTSRFSQRRFHPVLKIHRPHYGVDYGAPTGTPVLVTASGTVSSVGWEKGAGKTVRVRHANGYLTAYLHLSRYAEGMKRGVAVGQGQVIGYVGSTGLATAPHLDYRVAQNGRYIDPLLVGSQSAALEPLTDEPLLRFLGHRDELRKVLDYDDSGLSLATASPAPAESGAAPGFSGSGSAREVAR